MADGEKVLNVAVVSAERALWSGQAKSLVAKTPEGDIGILPGHEPVLALLVESPLRIEELDGSKLVVAVHGGFFSVSGNEVNVIAEVAELVAVEIWIELIRGGPVATKSMLLAAPLGGPDVPEALEHHCLRSGTLYPRPAT